MKLFADKKPSVNSTTWRRIFHYDTAQVMASEKYYDFYKAVVEGERPKYFFGESAWMNCQRYVVDKIGPKGYNIFD